MEAAIAALIAQYHAGLEAELALLQRLEGIAARQREASEDGDMEALGLAGDERDQAMSALVVIEHELKPIRLELVAMRDDLKEVPAFEAVAALHRHAAQRVNTIVAGDQKALEALKEAERSRSLAARIVEQGESTMAAYRRVVAPETHASSLFDRKG